MAEPQSDLDSRVFWSLLQAKSADVSEWLAHLLLIHVIS